MDKEKEQVTKNYWKSIDEKYETPEFIEKAEQEFQTSPLKEEADKSGLARRQFMKLMGASVALSTAACVRRPVQKIIPYNWSAFDDMSNKNHLEIFKNKLSKDELKKMDLIFSELDQKWEKDYREYKSISFLTDKEMVVRWNNERGMYDEIK